jgi:hypothetical protein
MLVRALLVWLALLVVAVANGLFREAVLLPRLGVAAARAVSNVTLCAFIALLTWVTIDWIAPSTAPEALALGALWVTLTVGFELGFGRLVAHKPWSELLADYNVLRGRIWLLVLITTGLAPYLMARIRGLL